MAHNNKKEIQLFTGKEVQEMLQVSRQTLYNWKNNGVLLPHKIVGKLFYKLECIEAALSKTNLKSEKQEISTKISGGEYE